jgi:hypothetical protein
MTPPPPPRAGPERAVRSISWAAGELGISVGHARRLAAEGQFPGAFRLGKSWRVAVAVFRRELDVLARERARLDHPAGSSKVEQLRLIVADAPVVPIAASSPSPTILSTDRAKALSVIEPVDTVDMRVSTRKRSQERANDASAHFHRPQATGENSDE